MTSHTTREVDVASTVSSVSAQLCSAAANTCMFHVYFKPLLLDLLRQRLPPDASLRQDVVEWVDKHSIVAQLMVNSILDAGMLLSDLYEGCPQIANGAQLLRMHTDYIARVNALLSAPLVGFSVLCNAEAFQSLCGLDQQAYLSVSKAMRSELQKVLGQAAFKRAQSLAADLQRNRKDWEQAGQSWLEARTKQWQSIRMKHMEDAQAEWDEYQRRQQRAQELYDNDVTKLSSQAGKLLHDAFRAQHYEKYELLEAAFLGQQVWEACKRSKHALQPLQLAKAGFQERDEKMMVLHFRQCSHSNVNVLICCHNAVIIHLGGLCQKLSFAPGPDRSVQCLITDSSTFQLDVYITPLKAQRRAETASPFNVISDSSDICSSNKRTFHAADLSNMTEDTEQLFPDQQRICIQVDKAPHLECMRGKYPLTGNTFKLFMEQTSLRLCFGKSML